MLVLTVMSFGCNDASPTPLLLESDYVPLAQDSIAPLEISKLGKIRSATRLYDVYTPQNLDTFSFPLIDEYALLALQRQRRLLHKKRRKFNRQIGKLRVDWDDLYQTVDILESWQHLVPIGMEKELDAHQLWGKDRKGNVKFTAYFAPVIQVSRTASVVYKYPIRSAPKGYVGRLPDRKSIEEGALDGAVQHLAYAKSKADIYYLQLQGSGYIQYENGTRDLLSYAGENRHPYRSVESYLAKNSRALRISDVSMQGVKKFLVKRPDLVDEVLNQNPSYVFFRRRQAPPTGAGLVPLTAQMSIAVDPKYIPLGSCLLASVPVMDKNNKVVGHEPRLLFAQDKGGAIKGGGHIDIYFGAGEEAERSANNFNAYGRLWLLLPKRQLPMLIYSYNNNTLKDKAQNEG